MSEIEIQISVEAGPWPDEKTLSSMSERVIGTAARHLADLLHREDLSGQIRDVAEVEHSRRWRDRAQQLIGAHVHRLRRHRK